MRFENSLVCFMRIPEGFGSGHAVTHLHVLEESSSDTGTAGAGALKIHHYSRQPSIINHFGSNHKRALLAGLETSERGKNRE